MRNHFAADFAEAAQAIGDAQETVFIDGGDVTGVVPAALQYVRSFVGTIQVTHHDVWPAHQQQARLVDGQRFARFGINDAHADAGQRMADGAAFRTDLAEIGSAKIVGVHRHYRRTFRATVTLQRTDSKMIFK